MECARSNIEKVPKKLTLTLNLTMTLNLTPNLTLTLISPTYYLTETQLQPIGNSVATHRHRKHFVKLNVMNDQILPQKVI